GKTTLLINWQNDFYQHKKQSLTSLWDNDARLRLNEVCYKNRIQLLMRAKQLWVFPNDARGATQFESCFACPHWTAELHSRLLLYLQQLL
ncbi:MAG: hypothetical protein AAFO94_23180, partial [Bacteroidota bacterium]